MTLLVSIKKKYITNHFYVLVFEFRKIQKNFFIEKHFIFLQKSLNCFVFVPTHNYNDFGQRKFAEVKIYLTLKFKDFNCFCQTKKHLNKK